MGFLLDLQTVIEVPDAEFVCVTDLVPIIVSVSTVAAILALILVSLLLIHKYRGEIKVILYMKFGWHPFDSTDDTDIVGKVSWYPVMMNWLVVYQHLSGTRFIEIFSAILDGVMQQNFNMGLLPDTQNCGLRMRQECREGFPGYRGLAIPTCITARAWRTCRDEYHDR